MKCKYLILLVALYFVYLLVGAAIFQAIERPLEIERCNIAKMYVQSFHNKFTNLSESNFTAKEVWNMVHDVAELYKKGIEFCSKRDQNRSCIHTNFTVTCPVHWDFESSLFFCGTVVTTIGYGNVTPTSDLSRAICVVYALVGIVIFAAMFNGLSEAFSYSMKHVSTKVDNMNMEKWSKNLLLFTIFVAFGFTFFSFIPGVIFSAVEGWSFGISVYYSIITLTTIGFGDYVAGKNPSIDYFFMYRTMVYFWILFGLAFMATTFNVMSDRLKHRSRAFIKSKSTTFKRAISQRRRSRSSNKIVNNETNLSVIS